MKQVTFLAVLMSAWLLTLGAPLCQTVDPNQRFNQAAQLAAEKKYDKALDIWLDLRDKLDEKFRPNLHKALGLAYLKLMMYPQSWHHLIVYLRVKPDDKKADGWLRKVQWELSQNYYKARFQCRPLESEVVIGTGAKAVAYPCPLTWWFKPADYLITVQKAGFKTVTIPVTVSLENADKEYSVELEAEPTPVNPTPAPTTTATPVTKGPIKATALPPPTVVRLPESGGSKFIEWTLIVTGTAIAGAGGFLQWQAGQKNEELHDTFLDKDKLPSWKIAQNNYNKAFDNEVRSREIGAGVLYGIGGAVVVTGIIMLAVGGDGKGSTVSLSPTTFAGGTGAVVSWDF